MKKFYIILSVLLLSLFWLVGNCSFAAGINYTDFNEWNYNGTRENLSNAIFNEYLNVSFTDYRDYMNPNLGTNDQNRVDTFFTRFFSNDFTCFYWSVGTNNNNYNNKYIYIYLSTNDFTNTTYKYQFYKLKTSSYYSCTLSSSTSATIIDGSLGNGGIDKYLLNSSGVFYKNGTYTPPQLTMTFIPLSNEIKNIGGINFFIQNFTRYETFFKIGQIGNFDYREDYRGICAMLVNGVYQNSNIQLYINPNGEVFVYTSNLLFNQGYGFKFFNGDLETDIYNFYFIPNGSNSGDISSGDYVYNGFDNNDIVPIANIVNSQYDVNSGEMGAYIDNTLFPSGDFSTIASAYDFDSFENQYFNYIYGFFTNIINTLTQSGEVTLPISYRNFNLTLKSSDFYVPNNALKTLVTTILIVYTFFLVYQQLDLMFRHIREFNLFGFLHDTDVDYHMFL